MDLWIILTTLARRWYLSLPLVVASVVGAFMLANALANSYSAEATVLIAAPNERLVEVFVDPTDPTNRETRIEVVDANPLVEGVGDVGLAAQTLQLTLESDAIVDQMDSLGLAWDTYFVTPLDTNGSILVVSADGTSPEQAISTVEYLIARIDSDLDALQDRLGAPDTARIDDEVLTRPTEAFITSSGKPRIILGVTLAGLVLTVLLVSGFDSLLRPKTQATQGAVPAPASRRAIESVRTAEDEDLDAPPRRSARRSSKPKPEPENETEDESEGSGRWQRTGSR